MSDATDAVAEAIGLNKRLAAKHLVRKQELEAEIEDLQRGDAGDPAVAARMTAATTELLAATQSYKDAMAELAELDRLGHQARRNDAQVIASSVTDRDPLIRSNEQIALDNVRERAADLAAGDLLAQELGERPKPAPAPRAPTREEADATARSEFEALRAKRGAPTPTADAPADGDGDAPPARPTPPKKTL